MARAAGFLSAGVASGDPHPDSVILWTRRPPSTDSEAKSLIVEIAADPDFRHVIATAKATLSAEADWTTRVLAAGLKPRRVYWYRFTDEHGSAAEWDARSRRRRKAIIGP